ncbi:MAG TPA: hypothetical protein ENN09_02820 [Planctomycetes bacterium]|nr:hypothetical protein [Planctomycetota bacterium]
MSVQMLMLGIIALPFAVGCLVFVVPRQGRLLVKALALLVSAAVLGMAGQLVRLLPPDSSLILDWHPSWGIAAWAGAPLLAVDALAGLMLVAAGFFAFLVAVYSVGFLKEEDVPSRRYYAYYLWVLAATCGALLSSNLILFIAFWGFAGIPLFLLVAMGKGEAAGKAAKKSLIILGATDSLLILGAAFLYMITRNWRMEAYGFSTLSADVFLICLCFTAAALAKAGAFPFHSWVPDAASSGPVPVAAYLPASLDKLLGVYFLVRIFHEFFEIDPLLRLAFMLIGVATVLGAVLLALAQHDMRKLLGFHAVSQVGYMVLGIASGSVIGLVGGLFHMLNNTLYKTILFLTGGAAEKHSGTGELEKMGGMSGVMPGTFFAALVGALAISGVPPLNGFFSKWLVYQGIIDFGGMKEAGGALWVLILVGAMFGSALTLASFVKVIFSVYLDRPAAAFNGPRPNLAMTVPSILLAVLCIVFGIAAVQIPIRYLVLPAVGVTEADFSPAGLWQPQYATLFLVVGLVLGAVIYGVSRIKIREDDAFLGGEYGPVANAWRFTGTEFYKTVSAEGVLKSWYKSAVKGSEDLYGASTGFALYLGQMLRFFHSGALPTYLAWCVLGAAALLAAFCLM